MQAGNGSKISQKDSLDRATNQGKAPLHGRRREVVRPADCIKALDLVDNLVFMHDYDGRHHVHSQTLNKERVLLCINLEHADVHVPRGQELKVPIHNLQSQRRSKEWETVAARTV
jgi:hypothetical protein